MTEVQLPPGQQLAARDRWPVVGERSPRLGNEPWTVRVRGSVGHPRTWTLEQLRCQPAVEMAVDVHCVTRWSRLGMKFRGVPLARLIALAEPHDEARFVSFVARSERSHSTSLPLADVLRLDALVALECEGRPLSQEHGGPVRMVVPGRYFYKSLKWLSAIELLPADRLGFWESQAGYHNAADPWREQRYIAAGLSRAQMARIVATRDFAGRDLLGIEAAGRDLTGLDASQALLRNADFRGCRLAGAKFDGAHLSNARLARADLRRASFVAADVEWADFTGADLRGADFRGASLLAATFAGVRPSDGAWVDGAVLDAATQIEPAAIESLLPLQAEYVRQQLGTRQ